MEFFDIKAHPYPPKIRVEMIPTTLTFLLPASYLKGSVFLLPILVHAAFSIISPAGRSMERSMGSDSIDLDPFVYLHSLNQHLLCKQSSLTLRSPLKVAGLGDHNASAQAWR